MNLPSKKWAIESATPGIKADDYFSDEEVLKIASRIQNPIFRERAVRKRYFLLFKVLLRTGARISEALSMVPEDFDLYTNTVRITTLKKRKKGAYRTIPLHQDLKETFMSYLLEFGINPKSEDRLFPMSRQAVDEFFKGLEEPGLQIHAHKFRHTFAIRSLRAGSPINTVQKWLGHSSIFTTSVYTEITAQDTQEYMERIP